MPNLNGQNGKRQNGKTGATTKVGIVSLGCAKNLVDSEVMLGLLQSEGYEITPDETDADVIIVNTCSFIGPAKQESIDNILQAARNKKTGKCRALIVAGCMGQRYGEELLEEVPEVDAVIGTGEVPEIAGVVRRALGGERFTRIGIPDYLYNGDAPRVISTGAHSVYIKLAEGCDHPCTFCIIPRLRGRYRSRTMESVLEEARMRVEAGAKELILIAQDTSAYGRDIYGRYVLPELLNRLSELEDLRWIRVLYTYPTHFTDQLIEVFASNPKVCKYVDLPLQHSETRILKAMKRAGDRKLIEKLLDRLRERVQDLTIRTSFIVGFAGETERDFENLLEFLERQRFDHVGVFTYSPEEGTPAYTMKHQIPEKLKQKRRDRAMKLQKGISRELNELKVGRILEILVDEPSPETDLVWMGRYQGQAPEVDGVVYIGRADLRPGDFVRGRIIKAYDYDLVAEVRDAP